MQIRIYLFCLVFFTGFNSSAQELFPKKELYHVWILAGEDLDAGKFDAALELYRSHAEHPNFSMKVRQIARLKEILSEAERLRKRGNYAEAVDKFKEYRKLKNIGTIGYFESRIEDCLNQISKRNIAELTAQQRIITGFEFAHRGRQKLSQMDTIGAKRDFNNARVLGGNRNNVLKEQYVEGLRVTGELTQWGNKYLKSSDSGQPLAQQLFSLESYRNIRNIDIPDIELRIKELKAELDGIGSLSGIAKLCDPELLARYVNTNKTKITASGFLLSRLNEFQSTRRKIDLLKRDTLNVRTIQSAYSSLFSWVEELPQEIRVDIRNCIQTEYDAYMATLPSIVSAQVIQAKPTINCKGREDFEQGILLIKKELSDCNILRARSLWITNVSYLRDCDNSTEILNNNKSLGDSIIRMVKSDSLLRLYREQVQKMVAAGECSKTPEVYEKMKLLKVCNPQELDEEIRLGLAKPGKCTNNSWWKPELTAGFAGIAPKYTIANQKKEIENGWAGSVGVQLSFIDHKNLADFVIGVEYFQSSYSSVDSYQSALEDFKLSGINGVLSIKLHRPNTNPKRFRPYFRFGPEVLIPLSYEYKNYSTAQEISGTDQLQKTVLSVTGALGIEIQKAHFGAFLEGFGSYSLGSIYNSSVSHMNTANQKIDARISKFGLKIGFRIW